MSAAPGEDFYAYLNEDSSGFPLQAAIVCIVLVTITYALRLVSRHLQRAPWGWDDTLMVPAYLFTIGTGGSVICMLFTTYLWSNLTSMQMRR